MNASHSCVFDSCRRKTVWPLWTNGKINPASSKILKMLIASTIVSLGDVGSFLFSAVNTSGVHQMFLPRCDHIHSTAMRVFDFTQAIYFGALYFLGFAGIRS